MLQVKYLLLMSWIGITIISETVTAQGNLSKPTPSASEVAIQLPPINLKKYTDTIGHCATLVMVSVEASWCGPCKIMKPIIESVLDTIGSKLLFLRVDADLNRDIYAHLNVESMPALIFYRNGKMVMQQIGILPKKQLLELISSL